MYVSHCMCLLFSSLILRHKMAEANPKPRCFLCGRNHALKHCLTFRKMLISERRSALVGQSVCLNCFGYGHKRATCPSKNRCQTCQANHHTMIHRPRHERASSCEETPTLPDRKPAVPLTSQSPYEKMPFHERILTSERARPFNWQRPNPQEDNIEIAPVVLCELKTANGRQVVTLMVCPDVPKSHLTYSSVQSLLGASAFTKEVLHASFEILLPEGGIVERFAIVRNLLIYVPPAIQRADLMQFAEGRKLAHPEPHKYNRVDGILGKDLEEKIMLGKMQKAEKNPNIRTQDTVFGVIFCGTWARSSKPFLKSLCPLERRLDGPFGSQLPPATPL